MASNLKYSASLKNLQQDALTTRVGASCLIDIMSGTQATNPDTAIGAQVILATVAALLGFATLLTGGFSRFGVWRQVVGALFLIILVKMIETLVAGTVRDSAALWPLIYLPAAFGFGVVWFLLFWSTRPYLFRRRPVVTGAGA